MKIFVTGATGFVGSHLVDALLARGDDVTCLARDPAKAERLFAEERPRIVAGDLATAEALRAGCCGADVVFHVAAATAARTRADLFHINIDGTRNLVAAVQEAAPDAERIVYVSSQAAAGPTPPGDIRTEEDPPEPVSDYGRSKLAAEAIVQKCRVPWTVVRPTSVYGPRDTEFLRVCKFARRGIVPVPGNAAQLLSFVHVHDLVRGLLCTTAPAARGKTYFACHREVVSVRGLAGHVYAALLSQDDRPRSRPFVITIPPWATRATLTATGWIARIAGRETLLNADKANELLAGSWTCSPTALERDTGWKAEIGLAAGMRDTVRWYREHDWL